MSDGKVYLARQPRGHYLKIGVTTNLKRRMSELGLEMIACFTPWDSTPKKFERDLHKRFASSRAPFGTEWFEPTPEVRAYFKTEWDIRL